MSFGLIVKNAQGVVTLNSSTNTTLLLLNIFVSAQSGTIAMTIENPEKCIGIVVYAPNPFPTIAARVTVTSSGVSWQFNSPLVTGQHRLLVWRIL